MGVDQNLSAPLSVVSPETEFQALQAVIKALQPLDKEARNRILESTAMFLGIAAVQPRAREANQPSTIYTSSVPQGSGTTPFSESTDLTPKEFLMEKAPKTDVERIACLAYYLTHYRDTPNFKTLDISRLNTEAALPKFSNPAYTSANAGKMGYIVPSTKGHRQLSALGERFVQALPDRDAAKDVLLSLRRKNRSKRRRTAAASESAEEE